MADAYTQVSSLSSSVAAYEQLSYFALRPELYFPTCATIKPTRQDKPGSSVVFTLYDDMAEATTALTETSDVDAVAISDSQVTVTLVEQGNAALTTAKLRGTSFLQVDPDVANVIGFNAGISFDTLARTPLAAGTNVDMATGGAATPAARANIDADDVIAADDVRKVTANARAANAQPWSNGFYKTFIHPDVSLDLRAETGADKWRDPHTYSKIENIENGEIGAFEGQKFLETPRAPLYADGGTTTVDAYATITVGKQALAMAYSRAVSAPMPKVVLGPQTDKLRRFHPIGWYWLGGFARFREASIYRIESSSSIGDNA